MVFEGVCLVTDDVVKLSTFYANILQTTTEGDAVHAEVHTQGAGIAIFAREASQDFTPSPQNMCNRVVYLMFLVKDVDAEYERLKTMNVQFLTTPTTHPWGRRAFAFKDPDGNMVNFASKVKG